MRKPIRILVNGSLILASAVVALLAAELALRFWYFGALQAPEFGAEILLRKPHPELGWTLLPNASALAQTLDYTVRVDINSQGLRDREHAYEPEPDVFRVLVLGDSFMEAQQVWLEDCLARQLEKKLAGRRVEVINLGVTAYGTAQEYLLLGAEGLKYQPDLVVLAFFAHNDLTNNAFKLERILWGRDDIRVAGRPFLLPGKGPELAFTTPDYEKALAQYDKSLGAHAARDSRRALHERTVIGQLYTLAQRAYGDTGHNVPEHDPNVHFGPYLDTFDATLSSNKQMTNAWYVERWTDAWD
ncbi:MAG: SGNH/GDSL hydrolase family protein, partial [Candidatus Hydrogenedentes bacterium]|nr:SGNH/GDSL hydrolase family protein [Candidatus Hydrogenedentota bacterium]